ncbi:MAG TPA: TIR domain-containing protein [Anaeromyxobacteraceae bacterium]|nr:TIR domain-containing protein [Anaeromyxobacteraceae bacterium]
MGTDVFVSYAREDAPRIHELVGALEGKGWSVFWDHRIPAGQSWRSYIGKALDDTRRAIVVWSKASIASEFVLEEASRAKRRGILVPVRIDPVDPPLGFGEINAADLCGWHPSRSSPEFEQLVQDLEAVLAQRPSAGAPAPRPEPALTRPAAPPIGVAAPGALRRRALLLGGVAVGVVAIAATLFAMKSGPDLPAQPGGAGAVKPIGAGAVQPGGHAVATPVMDPGLITAVAKPVPIVLPPKSVREALDRYNYEIGWSGAQIGTPDKGFTRSAVTKVAWRTADLVEIELARPSYLRAAAGSHTLSGTWKDVDGHGDFSLEFVADYSRAEGWWNRGGLTQKYNMFLGRTMQ